ncbi:MAG TPA: universal stress protein [Cyclobacteriaceae bacterium]|nr:universal stress protein [Cyclobacteriaceae bacterium]HRK54031.1 universal stress protein [Cyclobacteriaceae bacterium]
MKTVFAATDYSEIGNNAVRYAIDYANSLQVGLLVFHTGPVPKFNPLISEEEFFKLDQAEVQRNVDKLSKLIDDIYDKGKFTLDRSKISPIAKTGVISSDTILAEAKKHDADLIIVGTHGRTGLKLFGTTSATLIQQSKIPILAIPPGYRYKGVETISYASDFRNPVNELKRIVPFVKKSGAQIEILHLDSGEKTNKQQTLSNELESQVGYDNIRVVIEKDVDELTILGQIERHIKSSNPDILVMFPESRSYFDRLFGIGKTEELAYKTQLPLLTFRKEDIDS